MPGLWTYGIDYRGQPLFDAWWTPGWTSQNDSYIQVPTNQFAAAGFPSGLKYVIVSGNFFDMAADPLSGYLTFYPSSDLTITQTVNSVATTTYMPKRYSGVNQTMLGLNQMGDRKIFLWKGQLSVSLLASDNANMVPVTFTYHVKENWLGGLQYDIFVPSADVGVYVDIHNLIIPGSIKDGNEDQEEGQDNNPQDDHISIPVTSSQYIAVDLTTMAAGMAINPTSFPVNLAFISGPTQPTQNQYVQAQWAPNQSGPEFVAQLLVGPNGYVLAPGTYKIWAQVQALPQAPVIPVGFVTIY